MDCLFCRIVSGEVPSTPVLERDTIYAFRDIAPVAPVHVLIVPRAHIDDARDVTGEDGGLVAEMFDAAGEVARAEGVADSGYRLIFNVGPDAGQSVLHLHMHLVGGRPLGSVAH